jgi:hypothetical protein
LLRRSEKFDAGGSMGPRSGLVVSVYGFERKMDEKGFLKET